MKDDIQRTIEESFSVEGIGVHTGRNAKITIKQGLPDTGIIFYRDGISIPAIANNVNHTGHGVTLKSNGKEIKTCEHILSALYGVGVDNAICEIEGEEIPAMDGSALEFTKHIKVRAYSNTPLQSAKRRELKIKEPIFCEPTPPNGSCIFALPDSQFKITFLINYPHPGIKTQCNTFTITPKVYCNEIAPARTYIFANWIDKLKKEGLIRGGSLENAVVIGDDGPVNSLRFEDEQVRHKILDLIGDIALLGARLKGWVVAIKSGHSLNIEFLRRLKSCCER